MAWMNENYNNVKETYLFSEIAKRVKAFSQSNPDKRVMRLGIGDVTQPLPRTVVTAMRRAVDEMGKAETFRGYGPEQGYDFLREAIAGYYGKKGVDIDPDEIFVSDGAKSDTGNIGDIFDGRNRVLIPDPVYPVYVDTNRMAGRSIELLPCVMDNGFAPEPPPTPSDIVYLCSPNNPTGSVLTRELLGWWVDYALRHKAIILFDAAYEAYIADPSLPRSIFEIPDARLCAVEFCSLSKTAGFTGTRCAWTVVPKELMAYASDGSRTPVRKLWNRRHTTKFNGVPYIVQRGAAAVFTPEGLAEVEGLIAYYRENARIIADALDACGIEFVGGKNSPYLWLKCPGGLASWDFFDKLLHEVCVVGTPGAGFGECGEGYFRLTAFGKREDTLEAAARIKDWLAK